MKNLTIGDKLTIIYVSDFLATTHRCEVILKDIRPDMLVLSERGKRKVFGRKLSDKWLIVLPGHNLPIKADTDAFNSFCGNARFNLVAETPEILKATLDTAIQPLTDFQKEHVLYLAPGFDAQPEVEGVPLYPELNDVA